MEPEKKLKVIVMILVAVVLFGIIGYSVIERWPLLDAVYMTFITLSTVGFKEVYVLSPAGRMFTILLILVGVAGAAYTLRVIGEWIVEGEMQKLLGRRRMQKGIKELVNHYVVCGFGRVGRRIAQELCNRKVPFVVIDNDLQRIEQAEKDGFLFFQGDSTIDQTLIDARIERARALITAVANEADGVFIVLSARQLNPQLLITARAETDEGKKKLLRAGANKVISPYKIGAIRMALTTLRPNLVDFMKVITFDKETGLTIEEIQIKPGSPMIDSTLRECAIRKEFGIMVAGIKKTGKDVFLNPSPDTKIEAGDILIVIGDREGLEKLEKLYEG
ncbi:MAG: potassium channel protein [Candidatus Zixiibacteriota bacterium]